MLFARAEALHAHGHAREACKLARQLAEELLANPPNFSVDFPAQPSKSKLVGYWFSDLLREFSLVG